MLVPVLTSPVIVPPYTLEQCRSLPRFDRSVSLLCWAYNEEQIIRDYLVMANETLQRTVEDYEIIVIDDCSTDRTNQIVTALQATCARITLIRNPVNLNVGPSFQKAIASATKDYLFWQTIDWAYDISLLRTFLELLKSYDVVAGVRKEPVEIADRIAFVKPLLGLLRLFHINHVTRRSDTIPKAVISIINYLLVRVLFNVPLSDYQNVGFYPTPLIQSLKFESRSSFSNPEVLMKCYWAGCSIAEVPISFLPRRAGLAKGTTAKAIRNSISDIFRLWVRWVILGRKPTVTMGSIRRLKPQEWKAE